jgi:hypothetical protein
MKNLLSAFLLLLSLQSFGQLTGKTVTTIKLKMAEQNTTFQKVKESEWKMVQKGADGSNTEISGFNVLSADNNSITLEQKDFGVNLKIDLTTKKVTALENGKPSAQKFLFIIANNDPVELEKADVVNIDKSINGTNVSMLKWKNEMMNQVFELHKADNNEWEYYEEAIKMKESFPSEEKLFKQTASDNNSITLVEINPDPKNTMFYATKLKIDIAAKVIYKAVYEADTKKWTPLEKEQNGTNVFLIIN